MSLPGDRYSWGVSSSRGVALGLGTVRLAILGLGLVAAALGLYAHVPVVMALAAPVAAATYVWLPGGSGRVAHETATVAAAHALRRHDGSAKAGAGVPAIPLSSRSGQPWWPKELRGLGLERVRVDGAELGVLLSRHGSRPVATAVFSVVGPPRSRLMGTPEQASLVAGWGSVLSGLALERSRVTRVQWVERSAPARSEALRPGTRPGYAALVAGVEAQAVEHQVYVAVQVRARPDQLGEVTGEWRLLASRLAGAGLAAVPLGPETLSGVLRCWSDGRGGPAQWGQAGPACWRENWRELDTGGRLHRCFAVAAWPRVPVGPAWLEPLVAEAPAGVERSVAVHLEAIPAALAARQLRGARTGHALEGEHRARSM